MYEMEGPRLTRSPTCRSLGWPVTRLLSAADHTTSARRPPETSGFPDLPASRSLPRGSGVSPGSASALSGECFSTASPRACTRASGNQSQDSLAIHKTLAVIPRVARFFHRSIHTMVHSRQPAAQRATPVPGPSAGPAQARAGSARRQLVGARGGDELVALVIGVQPVGSVQVRIGDPGQGPHIQAHGTVGLRLLANDVAGLPHALARDLT